MTFERMEAENWQLEVPGARWFKADLHLHTIDDHPGGKAKLPEGLTGEPDDSAVQGRYARLFLQRLVAQGIRVAGLTPHSPRAGSGPESSATWRIIEEWNAGVDDDGVPFREKIFAVFPGFEIKVRDGAQGVHLLFLFDPETGRDRYLRLFDAVMDGATAWEGGSLAMTRKSAEDVLDTLDGGRLAGSGGEHSLGYLALAPHLLASHGLQREMGHQARELFPVARLAGIGMPREKLLEDYDEAKKPGRYWLPRMKDRRQAFFRGSDAYTLAEMGCRYTWIKLASPRIEALRQAFVASDSRMRESLQRACDGSLVPIDEPPEAAGGRRPWLRRVTVEGRASFFGAKDGGATSFFFSPDLTCVIGGSMTGKSTLLDGLRVHTEADLPQRASMSEQVKSRGENFLAGAAQVALDCPGRDHTAPLCEQWPAQFFAQNELQRLAQKDAAVEEILAKLDSGEALLIATRRDLLRAQDAELSSLATALSHLDEQLSEAEQAEARARRAQGELQAFEEAGVEDFHRVSRAHQSWRGASGEAKELARKADEVTGSIVAFGLPDADEAVERALETDKFAGSTASELRARWSGIGEQFEKARRAIRVWSRDVSGFAEQIGAGESSLREVVEQTMAAHGHGRAELREFQELSRQAALLPSYAKHFEEIRRERLEKSERFAELLEARKIVVDEYRSSFDRVISGVVGQPGSRIRGRRIDEGISAPLRDFLESLKKRGITRWWRDLSEPRPTPAVLLDVLEGKTLGTLGMSSAVQGTFREVMTAGRRRRLATLRCHDQYVLELQVETGDYRPLSELSGGQRVSVLLTLLFETEDDRPLVIDQPEDELDSRFLFEAVLPVLKKLKGRRQVIVATHNANIVVNGDADMVIQLEATAYKGGVASAGAIDEPAVRDAIVQTVDGGRYAFWLRRQKYGF